MNVIIKTFNQKEYYVEIPSGKVTILELKNAIETQHGFNKDEMRLVFKRNDLNNNKTVNDYQIKKESIIIMTFIKKKNKNKVSVDDNKQSNICQEDKKTEGTTSSDTNKSNSISYVSMNNSSIVSIKNSILLTQIMEEIDALRDNDNNNNNNNNDNNNYNSEQLKILDMGFNNPEEELKGAIKPANGNVYTAAEYLDQGIPNQKIEYSPIDNIANKDNHEENNHYDLDDNIKNEEKLYKNIVTPEDNNNDEKDIKQNNKVINNDEDNFKATAEEHNNAKILGIAKVMYSQNPLNLMEILINICSSNPKFFESISNNPALFFNMLTEPITEEDRNYYLEYEKDMKKLNQEIKEDDKNESQEKEDQEKEKKQENNQISKEEVSVIQRLQALGGFTEEETINAYTLCDENEEFAATYLFEEQDRKNTNQN